MQHRSTRGLVTVDATMESLEPVARMLEDGAIAAITWGSPRRAIYALLTRADDGDATRRLNALKGRPASQVLAVVGATDVARRVADLTPGGRLGRLARACGKAAESYLERVYRVGPVALMLEARPEIPQSIVKIDDEGTARVLVVGESPDLDRDNFYDQLVRYLAVERGVLVAGSSGNRSGARTFTTWDHEAAEADFAPDIDVFVRPVLPIPRRRRRDAPVSCTGFDLTTPRPVLIRHGSLHPSVFRRALGDYSVSPTAQLIDGRQGAIAARAENLTKGR